MDKNIINENIPQYHFNAVKPKIACLMFGRATGKTTGPIADRMYDIWSLMPQSHSIMIVPSYQKFLSQMIPGLRKGLGKFKMRQETHWRYGKFFDERSKIPKPFIHPEIAKNFMHCCNGAGTSIVSLDRPETMGNGLDADSIIIDEGKLCDYDDIKEVLPTLRGNSDVFGNKYIHQSVLICSDKPTNSKGNWMYMYKDMQKKQVIDDILTFVFDIIPNIKEKLEASKSASGQYKLHRKLDEAMSELNELRKDAVLYLEASTIENIHNVGIDYIYAQKQLLSDLDFAVSIINQTVYDTKNGFYWALTTDLHGYEAPKYNNIDALIEEFGVDNLPKRTSAWDMDCNPHQPLDIALDYNNVINSLVVGQLHGKKYDQIKSMFALKSDSEHLENLVENFCDYYQGQINRTVNYFFDQTAINADAQGRESNHEVVIRILKKRAFNVNEIYLGRNSSYLYRYLLWEKLLTGKNEKGFTFGFSAINNEDWYIAMKQAPTKQGKTGFEKDKKSERDPNILPQFATHLTEASDTLVTGALMGHFAKELEFDDIRTK